MNKMREIRVEKVTLNVGRKEVGDVVDKAAILLERLTNSKPVKTTAHGNSKTFGVRPGLNIGVKVTLRGAKAEKVLRTLLASVGNQLKRRSFTPQGNVSFGIDEYLKIKELKYDPQIGILGFDVCINLERPGYSVKRRISKSPVGHTHRITKEDAIEYMQKTFGLEII